jgi:hypothetical protein
MTWLALVASCNTMRSAICRLVQAELGRAIHTWLIYSQASRERSRQVLTTILRMVNFDLARGFRAWYDLLKQNELMATVLRSLQDSALRRALNRWCHSFLSREALLLKMQTTLHCMTDGRQLMMAINAWKAVRTARKQLLKAAACFMGQATALAFRRWIASASDDHAALVAVSQWVHKGIAQAYRKWMGI